VGLSVMGVWVVGSPKSKLRGLVWKGKGRCQGGEMHGMAGPHNALKYALRLLGGSGLEWWVWGWSQGKKGPAATQLKGQTKWEGVGSRFELSRAWGFDDPPNSPEYVHRLVIALLSLPVCWEIVRGSRVWLYGHGG